jgi:GNAT superfamily N-acetyltransferase
MIGYRQMRAEDIGAGLALCRAAGWNQVERDWQLFLHLNPQGCRAATDDNGKVVGTVVTIPYQRRFAWIGMVLVDPAWRRQGIGTQLLKESLDILRITELVKLDATPAGREVYQRLNFVDEFRISRMHNPWVSDDKFLLNNCRSMRHGDIPALMPIDSDVFGADRRTLLSWLFEGAPEYAFVKEDSSGINAYCFGRAGYNFTHIGPLIAADMEAAKGLFCKVLLNCKGRPVITDASHINPKWVSWLTSLGFVEQRLLIRMHRGQNTWPGLPGNQFSIMGPEFG